MSTALETVIWTQALLTAWMLGHVGDGHRLTMRTPEETEAGTFVCDCGAELHARPVVPFDPACGLYAVTGPRPIPLPMVAPPPVMHGPPKGEMARRLARIADALHGCARSGRAVARVLSRTRTRNGLHKHG